MEEFDLASELVFYLTPDQREAIHSLQPVEGCRFLEVGAGLGVNALYMARQGAEVVAIDIARERLRSLQRLADGAGVPPERIHLVQCSAEALPFRSTCMNRVYSKAVLIHTDLERTVPELHRVLTAGGRGVFVEPMKHNPLVNAYRRTLAPQEWRQITRYFGSEEIGLFTQSFPRTSCRYFYLFGFVAFVWQFAVRVPLLFRVSLAGLSILDGILMRLAPVLNRLAWFVVIRTEK